MSKGAHSEADAKKCERFVKLFADTERAIKKLLPVAERKGDFQDLAFRYSQIRPGLPELADARKLKSVFELLKRERDLLTHTGWTHPALVPTEEVLKTLESLHAAITHPVTAHEAFVVGKAPVITVAPDWSLASVLQIVDERDFSQFPILDGDQFHGIITDHSITRFIAKRARNGLSLVDLTTLLVSHIHEEDRGRDAYRFVGRDMPIDALEREFRAAVELEAVFVSDSGSTSERILGIATTWDIARLDKKTTS